jgi:lipid-binding SYLF domain-containing protein
LTACSTTPQSAEGRADIRKDSDVALVKAKSNDPSMTTVFENAHGSAVFPKVGKGAVGVGGAYGKGILYEDGRMVGYCDVSQASIGVQLGAQTYTEIICFEDQKSFERFQTGNFTFDAQATAVALKSGAGANAKYSNGVAVFTMDETGLMFEAAIGGQKFGYQAL